MEPRVSLVTLGVWDLVRARAFYGELGFKASSIGGGAVVFMQARPMALCLGGERIWPATLMVRSNVGV